MSNVIPVDGLPDLMPDQSTLYLTTSVSEADQTLRRVLVREGLEMHEPYPGVMVVSFTAQSLHQLSIAWENELSPAELHLTKCRLTLDENEPSLAELMQTHSLGSLVAWINGQWLADVLRSRRLITHFQPIVTCVSREVFAYECLLRGQERDGQLIPPNRLYNAARDTGLLHPLDQAARLTAIESFVTNEMEMETCVFINVNPRSIEDPLRSLHSTLRATMSSGLSPERFVFEVVESDEIADLEGLMDILEFCRSAGCRVALDDLGAGYASLNLLARIKPDFIKLDMELIRDVDSDSYKSRVASKLLELAKELDVQTVVEGVETRGEWQWAVEHGADLAQGYFFARPAAVPPRIEFDAESSDTSVADDVPVECNTVSTS